MVPLERAVGRVCAEDVTASLDVPPFDRAAMDGYALVAETTAGATAEEPAKLECIERLYAGSIAEHAVKPGTCSEIATGAPVPEGADAVVMVEQTRRENGVILIERAAKPGQHITPRAADIHEGEVAVAMGTYLTPARVGAIAAVGEAQVRVYRRPRVKIGATGNEVVSPGNPMKPGQIFDINSYSLHALFTSLDCEVEIVPPCPDDIDTIKARIESCLDADLIVFSGGSSVGEKDVLQDAFHALGDVLFHGVAIKPGKPTMLARIKNKLVVGMPGYPTSCLSNGYMFLAPAVCKMARKQLPHRLKTRMPAAEDMPSMADKHQVLTVRVHEGKATRAFKESGVITSMSRADGFIEIPEGVDRISAGSEVEVNFL
jgi:molybdopterin molybdotransferase